MCHALVPTIGAVSPDGQVAPRAGTAGWFVDMARGGGGRDIASGQCFTHVYMSGIALCNGQFGWWSVSGISVMSVEQPILLESPALALIFMIIST